MSVVNKMLQDLENRDGLGDTNSADYTAPKSVSSRRATWMILFIGIAIGLFIVDRIIGINEVASQSLSYASNLIHGTSDDAHDATSKKAPRSFEEDTDNEQPDSSQVSMKNIETDSSGMLNATSDVSNSFTHESVAPEMASVTREFAPKDALARIDPNLQTRDPEVFEATFEQLANSPAETAPKVPLNASTEELEALQASEPQKASQGEMQISRVGRLSLDEKLQQMVEGATSAMNDKQPASAINILDRALELAPERHDIRKRLAVILFAHQQERLAETVLRDGVKLAPERIDLRLMLGRMLHRQKKMQSLYDMLLPITPDVNLHSEYIALQAAAAQQLGRFDEAAKLFTTLVDFDASRANWWLGLAIAEDKQARSNAALVAYKKVLELKQVSPTVLRFVENRIGALEN
ncbi:tetratricopeptide repeat protein [Alteromonas sp. a30]|uniref:tetratricopeptide repeat protein n=1 Tax=Alteromonas sp. a30 TaxID=2730917 RepID=UPI002280D37B|nr:tetratricopeptide repeat protein [Alteromonas sp. a30]MCY7295274.1 tetratricopeptide repeat protein [Alteromonas sp. a30]